MIKIVEKLIHKNVQGSSRQLDKHYVSDLFVRWRRASAQTRCVASRTPVAPGRAHPPSVSSPSAASSASPALPAETCTQKRCKTRTRAVSFTTQYSEWKSLWQMDELYLPHSSRKTERAYNLMSHNCQVATYRPKKNRKWSYLHLLDLTKVCVLAVGEKCACLIELGLDLHTLIVEHGELGLETLVFGRLDDHTLGQRRQLNAWNQRQRNATYVSKIQCSEMRRRKSVNRVRPVIGSQIVQVEYHTTYIHLEFLDLLECRLVVLLQLFQFAETCSRQLALILQFRDDLIEL